MSQNAKGSASTQDTSEDTIDSSKSGAARLRWIALAVLFVLTVGGVLAYWRYAEIYPSTDNAYTGADIVRIAPLVAGPVIGVYVEDDQKVSKGDPLFDIDPAPYEAALRGARAQFDAALNAAGTEGEHLKAAADQLETKRVALVDALTKYREAESANAPGADSSAAATDALKAVHDAQAAYANAHDAFNEAQDKDMVVTTPTAKLRGAAAQLDKATEDRVKTHVVAPGDGWVSNVRVRPGAVMGAGTPAFPLVEAGDWWVDANFKETDLARIQQGQPATIKLDMYPGYTIQGTVESISPGSGALFSVLPPENATGNWVKVTQRFPVRIKITSTNDPRRPLRVGATATVRVDTTGGGAGGARAEANPATEMPATDKPATDMSDKGTATQSAGTEDSSAEDSSAKGAQ
ncbi:HlyD family secretion protein [Methyloceanibacter sp.]|uniref:HlyD family secretion protein n=1 Tax=Methyloceanibacter sp. TaxID=1965321 RepID=UPI002C5AE518|nr:HlyD family secretion protein [Methyloceanibacter sp.]HML92864.1 HlyD family secretion protein [Methyloceanibacter sp.]